MNEMHANLGSVACDGLQTPWAMLQACEGTLFPRLEILASDLEPQVPESYSPVGFRHCIKHEDSDHLSFLSTCVRARSHTCQCLHFSLVPSLILLLNTELYDHLYLFS